MNLYNMLERGDKVLVARPSVRMVRRQIDRFGDWRGLDVQSDSKPQITIRNFSRWAPFSDRPETVGWYARTSSGQGRLQVAIPGVKSASVALTPEPVPVPIPWPLRAEPLSGGESLTLHFVTEAGQSGELMISKVLDRRELISLARGNGVEVGPGPRPQVVNGSDVTVRYVEDVSLERWQNLYDQSGRFNSGAADWSQYIIGVAGNLPVPDNSLDFIFSSHVFEHLANPLGHLAHWSRKLKPGGLVLAVTPDYSGSKDYRHTPSALDEFLAEFRAEIWEPQEHHYLRWAQTRKDAAATAAAAMSEKASIHVHFYSRENMARLLRHATQTLPYSDYHIRHTPNAKDFFFVLVRGDGDSDAPSAADTAASALTLSSAAP